MIDFKVRIELMSQKSILVSIFLVLPLLLQAHGSHGNGVLAGFTHPILGLDHAVAIFGTGSLAYILNPSKWYLQLFAFILAMIVGGLFGIGNEATLFIEKTIAFSVFFIGLAVAFNQRFNLISSIIILGVFGAFHGYAHGAEMAETNTALKYVSGYALGALLVGVVGVFLTKLVSSSSTNEKYVNLLGGAIVGAGIVMLLG